MKIVGIVIPFTTRKNPQPKKIIISPDSARIQREINYEKRLDMKCTNTKRLEKRIKSQKRGSLGD